MVVFYRGPCSRITHQVFETWCPTYICYVLRDLRELCVVKQVAHRSPAIGSMRSASTAVAGAITVVVALGWAEGWQVFDSPAVAIALLALLTAAAIVSGACWRVRPVQQELVATYHGDRVTLYRTTDSHEFEQVRRGLIRALDRLEDTR